MCFYLHEIGVTYGLLYLYPMHGNHGNSRKMEGLFFNLIENNNLAALEKSIKSIDINQHQLLHRTCRLYTGNELMVKTLLANGADPNKQTMAGSTPLHYVSVGNGFKTDVVQLLITHGALVNTRDAVGQTPLDLAMFHRRDPVAKFLWNRGGRQHRMSIPSWFQPYIDERNLMRQRVIVVLAIIKPRDIGRLIGKLIWSTVN